MAEDRTDFLGVVSKIINEKVSEFTAAHPDTPIYSQADKDKMAEGAADIISKFVSVPGDKASPDKSAKENSSEAVSRDIMPIIERVKKELPPRPCIKLIPSEAMPCNADINDYRFEDKLFSYCSKEYGEKINTIYKLKKHGYDTEKLYENEYEKHNSRIGGYPVFTQSDPRDAECTDCDTLLFQLDSFSERGSNSEIMWGDMGIANFFISKDALARCDFSKVMFNWDCG